MPWAISHDVRFHHHPRHKIELSILHKEMPIIIEEDFHVGFYHHEAALGPWLCLTMTMFSRVFPSRLTYKMNT